MTCGHKQKWRVQRILDAPFFAGAFMSNEDFMKFYERVLRDLSLQVELRRIEDREAFIKKVIELGGNSGLVFSRAEIEQQMQIKRKLWRDRWI
jgi:hypothetical protein